MFRLLAFVCFVFGFLLEIMHRPLGDFTPLAAGLLGLAFLALAGVDFAVVTRHVRR